MLPHSVRVHHSSHHFNLSLSDHFTCFVGQLEFVFGLMHCSCQQPRSLMDGDPSVVHVQTVPQVDAACRDETSATTELAAGGWADPRQCVLLSFNMLLNSIISLTCTDVVQCINGFAFFLSAELLWGSEVIRRTAKTVKKQACVKSSGQSRHEHHYKFIKSQDPKVRWVFGVIAERPRHATCLGLLMNCLATLWVKIQSKIIPWYLFGCDCVRRTKCVRDVRGESILWLFGQLSCVMSV